MNTIKTIMGAATGATLILAALPQAAQACSTCKCGDYTITLMGAEKGFSGRFRVGLDTLLRSESQGAGLEEQKTDEWRTTLGLAYSVSPDLTFAVQVPYVRKEIEAPNLARLEASGLGDIDLSARWTLWRSGNRHQAGLRGGLRLPTADEVKDGGDKLDIDVQPDAGAVAPSLGAWYGYYAYPWFGQVSASYVQYSEGHQNFHGGDVVLASALGQYALGQSVALQFGIDARQSQKNEFSGVADGDSGGFLAMGLIGAVVRFGSDFLVHAGVQLPLADNFNGTQDENASFRAGLAYDFGD